MTEDFVGVDESGLEVNAGSEVNDRQNDESVLDANAGSEADDRENDEVSPDEPVVEPSEPPAEEPSSPVEVVPPPASDPLDVPPVQDAFSVGDVLDAFTSGLFAGVSDDSPLSGDSSAAVPPESVTGSDEPLECVGIETYALVPVQSSTGLKGVLLDLLGPYDTVVTQFKYQQGNNSYYTYVNDISPDYPWIASALLFIVLLVSLFRFLGRCFRG